jgi:single-strand DNA-binding protein
MFQQVIIIGRLGRDPESRFLQDGTQIASFSVAVDKKWKDKSGTQQSKTTWFRVTAWNKLAEICNQYLKKGALVMVEGEMVAPKAYLDKQGQPAASLDITAATMKMLGTKGDGEHAEAQADGAQDDLPF